MSTGTICEVFVDGSPGPRKTDGHSGWGVAMLVGDTPVYEACGRTRERVTSNAAELEALIQGLGYLRGINLPSVTRVWTDSRYVADSVAKLGTLHAAGYMDRKGKEIPNAERLRLLYELLYEMGMANSAMIRWTKGHAKMAGNELADRLAHAAAYEGKEFYKEHDNEKY